MTKQPFVKPVVKAEISIDCGTGKDAYKVVLSGSSLSVFEKAKEKLGATDKKGEDLVAAILAAVAPSNIYCITRVKDGKRNDGANGEPALLNFNNRGQLLNVGHYKNGKMNDGADGSAAVQYFNSKGGVSFLSRYKNDLRNDGAKGEPSYQSFDSQGKPLRVEHYKAGKSNDGAKGEPALQVFFLGRLNNAFSYKDGKRVKQLSYTEVAAFVTKAKTSTAKKAKAPVRKGAGL